MMKRFSTTLPGLVLTYALMGSVVFTGVSLSRKLVGRWRVVKVYDADLRSSFPPMTIELNKDGQVVGRSSCGTFTGRWSTGRDHVRFRGLVPSGCRCGDLRTVEEQLIRAMGASEEHRLERTGLVLIDHGRPVARLVPLRT
ncbi:MAG: META domain-containing protein [Flavobacteriales bacterium]|nr:META domain-containing protein [Flavobacteriales bacterium]